MKIAGHKVVLLLVLWVGTGCDSYQVVYRGMDRVFIAGDCLSIESQISVFDSWRVNIFCKIISDAFMKCIVNDMTMVVNDRMGSCSRYTVPFRIISGSSCALESYGRLQFDADMSYNEVVVRGTLTDLRRAERQVIFNEAERIEVEFQIEMLRDGHAVSTNIVTAIPRVQQTWGDNGQTPVVE